MSVDQYKKEIGMMNLEKLIQDREGISSKKFSIPDKELLFRYEQLYTSLSLVSFSFIRSIS